MIPFSFLLSFIFFLPIYQFIRRLFIGKFEIELPLEAYLISALLYLALGMYYFSHYYLLGIEYLKLNQENSLFLAIGNNFIKYYKGYDALFAILIFVLIFGFISYKFYKFVFKKEESKQSE